MSGRQIEVVRVLRNNFRQTETKTTITVGEAKIAQQPEKVTFHASGMSSLAGDPLVLQAFAHCARRRRRY